MQKPNVSLGERGLYRVRRRRVKTSTRGARAPSAGRPAVEHFATELARRLLREDDTRAPASPIANSIGRTYFRAMELRRDRLRFLHDVALRPTLLEWNAFPLPPSLAPLHYLTRPVRLALKHAPRLLRRRA